VTAAKTAGYSGTPLAKKLGIGTGHRVWLVNAPANYKTLVSPLPDGVTFVSKASNTTDIVHLFTTKRREMEKTLRAARGTLKPDAAIWVSWPKKASNTTDIAHLFTTKRREMEKTLRAARGTLKPDAAIWVSWPKKASKVATDITEDVIREVALPMGFVDVKVCAVDETWSGLKLVVRKELRKT